MAPFSKVSTKSKSQALSERLSALARSLGPGEKLPTVAQLCETLDVSPRTLNFTLRDLEVQGVVERRNGVGIFVADGVDSRVSSRVALACDAYQIIRSNHSPFWDLLIEQAGRRVADRNEAFEMHLVGNPLGGDAPLPAPLTEAVRTGQIRAVIGIGLSDSAAHWLEEHDVPVVSFAGAGRAMVFPDSACFVRQGVAELIARGCRRIGLWRPVPDRTPLSPHMLQAALENFLNPAREEIERLGAQFHPELVQANLDLLRSGGQMPATGQEQGYTIALEVLQSDDRPHGILIADDIMATGAMSALRRLGLEPGRDIEVVTFANAGSPVLVGYEEQIAPFIFDPMDFARTLFHLLDSMLEGSELNRKIYRVPPRRRESGEERCRS